MSGLKGVKPPPQLGERTRDCSPGHAGKEGPHFAMKGASQWLFELWRPCGFSHEARRGCQGASRAAPGKSGLPSMRVVRGSASWLSSHGRELGPPEALKRDSRGLSRVGGGKPSFPSPSAGNLRELPRGPLRGEGSCVVPGPLGAPLGLAQRKRASPRGEAGSSGFLSVSDSNRRVPAELG